MNNFNNTNPLKRKTSETYEYESYSPDSLNVINWSTDESQIDTAESVSPNEGIITTQQPSSFFLESSQFPIIDKNTIQLNKIQFFSVEKICFSFCMKVVIARSQIITTLDGILEFRHAWVWHASFHGWFIVYLTEFQMQILIRIANIIKHGMFIDLEKYVDYAIRIESPKNKLTNSYVLSLNKKIENTIKELREFIKFNLWNFQGNSDFICLNICDYLGWYMEEFIDTRRLIYNGKPYDLIKKFSYKDDEEVKTLVHNSNKIIFFQLKHMHDENVNELIYNHQKNHNQFYFGMVLIQNPAFFGEEGGIFTEVEEYNNDDKYNEANKVIDVIDMPHYFKNIQQEQAEQYSTHIIHPITVLPLLRDGQNETNKCFDECRGRSYYRRFCRNYDEDGEDDCGGDSKNCKHSSSSERIFALDEEHSMLYKAESERKRKFSIDSKNLDFEFKKESKLKHRNYTKLCHLEKKNDILSQNNNSVLRGNSNKQELLEPNSIIEKSSTKKTLLIRILERPSNSSMLNSLVLDETNTCNLLNN